MEKVLKLKEFLEKNNLTPLDITEIEKYLEKEHLGISSRVPNKIFLVREFIKDSYKNLGYLAFNTQNKWNCYSLDYFI